MKIELNKYTADSGKVFVSKEDNKYAGGQIWLGVGTLFDDLFLEVDEADAIYDVEVIPEIPIDLVEKRIAELEERLKENEDKAAFSEKIFSKMKKMALLKSLFDD